MVSFEAWKFFILMKSTLFLLFFFYFGVISKKPLPNPRSHRFMRMLSSKSFIYLVLAFKSVMHFELIFVYGMR